MQPEIECWQTQFYCLWSAKKKPKKFVSFVETLISLQLTTADQFLIPNEKKLCFNRYVWIWKKNWSSPKTSNFRGKGSEGDFLPKFFGMFCEIFSVLESSDPLRCGWDLYKKSDFFDFKMLGSIFLQLQFSNREFLHNINSVLCNKLQCKS